MAEKLCVFCGTRLSWLGRQDLSCGGVLQPACKACWEKLIDMSQEERIPLALAGGRAVDPESMRHWLEARTAKLEARRAKLEAQRKQQLTDKVCLRCGGQMLRQGPKKFQLGEHTFFGGDREHLLAGALELDLLACEECGMAEFYMSPQSGRDQEEPKGETVVCPVCCNEHAAHTDCPTCQALARSRRGFAGTGDSSGEGEGRDREKPPWEK